MNVITVIGARPQFIKAAPVARALKEAGVREFLLHTGQHYESAMSQVFFDELGIAAPHWHLGCGGGSHGAMTGAMLAGIERILIDHSPDVVLVYGDTNSTLAGALAAAKLHIPVAHVEAGLRSFNKTMPEELNRICTDHISTWLFCPSDLAAGHLADEGVKSGIFVVGDVMEDGLRTTLKRVAREPERLARLGILGSGYALMTLHRAENTDDSERLASILRGISISGHEVVFPMHPRTRAALDRTGLALPPNVKSIPPVGYLDMAALIGGCQYILTDSGGLQKEAFWAGKPCLTLRDETEWNETVTTGWNTLVGASSERIATGSHNISAPTIAPQVNGVQGASQRIAELLLRSEC